MGMDLRTAGTEVARFLEAPRYGVVGTAEPDGSVWQAVAWYQVTDAGIVLNARDGRRWLTNLRRDTRLSLTVADGEDYVILRGQAVVTDDPERGLAEALALARRYRSADTYAGQRRVSVLFHPDHVAVHGEIHLGGDASGPFGSLE
jgi:PPOX class probable F420-dependent enzyme